MTTTVMLLLLQEHFANTPHEAGAEGWLVTVVQWLKLGVEAIGAAIIALGVVIAAAQFFRAIALRQRGDYNPIRLTLARHLALALEFQLGADILSTAVAPSWDQIGKLGAIAVIRTGLNYFLMREMKEEQKSSSEKEPTEVVAESIRS